MKDHYPQIGILKTCFKEKFGVPRQSLMVTAAKGIIKLNKDPLYFAAVNQLELFSHIWIVYVFHQNTSTKWHPVIDPPTLIKEKETGVFASRSPHRPNPIGLSVVKLEKIDLKAEGGIEIHVSGVDILDGSPVLDIKPYIPYADSIPTANSGWATEEIKRYPVGFSPQALQTIEKITLKEQPNLRLLLTQILEFDPRPTSQRRSLPLGSEKAEGEKFAFRLLDLDIHWQVINGAPYVVEIRHLPSSL